MATATTKAKAKTTAKRKPATKAIHAGVCPRCAGTGKVEQFAHRDGGQCYACKGAGAIAPKQPKAAGSKLPESLAVDFVGVALHKSGAYFVYVLDEADTAIRHYSLQADFEEAEKLRGKVLDLGAINTKYWYPVKEVTPA